MQSGIESRREASGVSRTMHNDHGQFDARSPLKSADFGVRAKPKWPLLAAAGVGGAVAGWFIPLSLIESITTATGLSEMIPALAPPLGSTMRMVLALGGGVSALALAAMFIGGSAKPKGRDTVRKAPVADDYRTVPEGVRLTPNARPAFDDGAADDPHSFQHNNGDSPMASRANVRQNARDFAARDDHDEGAESGGFFSRMKASLSKLPLPRRFEEEGADGGSIRDFSDLKRLRPGGDARDEATARAERPVRPIAAHAELGEPLPPLAHEAKMPVLPPKPQVEYDDDLAELERSARAAAERFAAENSAPAPIPAPIVTPQAPVFSAPVAEPVPVASPQMSVAAAPAPIAVPAPAPVSQPVRYDAEGIDALVSRLEKALANVRPVAAAAAPVAAESELDLAGFGEEQRLAEQAEAQRAAETARMDEERRAEAERQAQIDAEAEAKRRADALAAQEAARKAAEEADRAAEEARRRADEAQSLLASLGVEQATPAPSAPAPTPLRAVEQVMPAAAESEMDDALRSALRTLRRMSNP